MSGFTRPRVVELRALKRPLARRWRLPASLSIGDFGADAPFGNEQFRTLPFYLYPANRLLS